MQVLDSSFKVSCSGQLYVPCLIYRNTKSKLKAERNV